MATDDQTAEIDQLLSRAELEPRTHTFARLADLHREAGEPERALGVIREGLKDHPYYLDARLLHARVLLELGNEEAARTEFEHILTIDPGNPLACMALGVERTETEAGRTGRGTLADWLGQLEEAWQSDEADARPGPGSDASGTAAVRQKAIETATLAGLYASQGLFDRAIGVYEHMLSSDPDNVDLIAALAAMRRRAEAADGPGTSGAAVAGLRPEEGSAGRKEAAAPASAPAQESIGEQLRRILDGEAPAGSD